MHDHDAVQYADQMQCSRCGKAWDVNDPEPPLCAPLPCAPWLALGDGSKVHFGWPFTLKVSVAAKALSHINRFTGHVGEYSVAQHSVLVARALPPELRLDGLLHDIHESIIGDVSAPLKRVIGPLYGELERFYQDEIDRKFGVRTRHPAVVEADLRMCATEVLRYDLFPPEEVFKVKPFKGIRIEPWTAAHAYSAFMQMFQSEEPRVQRRAKRLG